MLHQHVQYFFIQPTRFNMMRCVSDVFHGINLLLNLPSSAKPKHSKLLRSFSHIDNVQRIAPTALECDVTVNLHSDPVTVPTTTRASIPCHPSHRFPHLPKLSARNIHFIYRTFATVLSACKLQSQHMQHKRPVPPRFTNNIPCDINIHTLFTCHILQVLDVVRKGCGILLGGLNCAQKPSHSLFALTTLGDSVLRVERFDRNTFTSAESDNTLKT